MCDRRKVRLFLVNLRRALVMRWCSYLNCNGNVYFWENHFPPALFVWRQWRTGISGVSHHVGPTQYHLMTETQHQGSLWVVTAARLLFGYMLNWPLNIKPGDTLSAGAERERGETCWDMLRDSLSVMIFNLMPAQDLISSSKIGWGSSIPAPVYFVSMTPP